MQETTIRSFMNYLGHLSQSDPLFGYLSADILPQLGIKGPRYDFRVFKVGNDMYRDIFGAQRVGMRTIFVDSNQGAKVLREHHTRLLCCPV
jgi:ribonucleotide monophosphatase NagD (HAD superfamily)